MPAGFAAGGLAVGIKASGRPDLAVIVTTGGPAAVAAVFTPNSFAAAPVRRSRAHLAATSADPRGGFGYANAVISTSGSANAATGQAGDDDQAAIARMLATAAGVEVERTLHLSTGIIGTRLPLDKVRDGLAAIMPTLAPTDDALTRGRGGAAHDRFGDQDRDHDDRAARCRRPAASRSPSAASPRASG